MMVGLGPLRRCGVAKRGRRRKREKKQSQRILLFFIRLISYPMWHVGALSTGAAGLYGSLGIAY